MENNQQIGTSLMLPVWLGIVLSIGAALLLRFIPDAASYAWLIVIALGLALAGAQFAARAVALHRLGGDMPEVGRLLRGRLSNGQLVLRNSSAPAGSLSASVGAAQQSLRGVIDGIAGDATEMTADVRRIWPSLRPVRRSSSACRAPAP